MSKRGVLGFAGLCLGMFAATAARAEHSPFFEDLPTVLTPSRLPQPLNEAPGSVTVLEGDFIRATGYRDLARVFRLVPGMQVGQERGHAQWVTYHGLGNNFPDELQVLIDGRSVYSASAFGSVDWSSLPVTPEEIERIEIVRGPNAVTYGANAFFGAINIITLHSAQRHGQQAGARTGSGGIADVSATLEGGGSRFTWRASAAAQRDEGFAGLDDSRRSVLASVRADWRLSSSDELLVRLGGSRAGEGEGYPVSVFNNNGLRETRISTQFFQLRWNHAPSTTEEWTLHYYRNHDRLRDRWNAAFGPPFVPVTTLVPLDRDRETTRQNLELQHRFEPQNDVKLVWGGELRREQVRSPFLYARGGPQHTGMDRVFANGQWRLSRAWMATAGLAYEHYHGEPARPAPRAFINWNPVAEHSLRAGYARAFAQRGTFEKEGDVIARDANGTVLVYPYVANPELRQPRLDSWEFGYLGRSRFWQSRFDLRVFDERITDYYVREQTTVTPAPLLAGTLPSTRYVNLARPIHLYGLEYQLRTHPWKGAEWTLSHAVIRRNFRELDIDDRTAPYSGSLAWRQNWGLGWSTTLTALRMGPLSGGDGFVPLYRYTARPYTAYDLRIAWRSPGKTGVTEVALNALNLGGRHQEIADRSQQAARAQSGDLAPANRVSPLVYLSLSHQF